MLTWREVGPEVYVRRHEELNLNCGLIVGEQRSVVVDTRIYHSQGVELLESVREITPTEVVVVNTHAHYDHCFGNSAFRNSQIYAHVRAADELRATAEHQREQVIAHLHRTDRGDLAATYAETEVVLPFYLIEEDVPLDLGGRDVWLLHGGPGHTDHDLVVAVPDAGTVFWADLVEHGADPAMEDSFPLEWGRTLRTLLAHPQVRGYTVGVPGHGDVVGPDFVTRQADQLCELGTVLAQELRSGVREVDALVAKCRGLGLQDSTLRDAAVRALETWPHRG